MTQHKWCTFPDIPFIQPWIERNYGPICQRHDEAYAAGKPRITRDIRFFGEALGHSLLQATMFGTAAILMPLVFIAFQVNTLLKKVGT